MTEPTRTPDEIDIDAGVAHVARVYDYMLGGTTNFEADRRAAERAAASAGGLPAVRASTRSNRAFLGRAVRHLADQRGIRQFLDLGSGLPTEQNVHQVAQAVAPDAKVVYVDYDATVLAHAHRLLNSGTEQGATAYVVADVRNPEVILEQAAATLDFDQPVAVLLFTILHNISDDDDPWAIVGRFVEAVCSGSGLAISHLTGDFNPAEMAAGKETLDEDMAEPFVLRTRDEILRFFAGTELEEPGLVHINDWHPDDGIPHIPEGAIKPPIYGGVALKP